MTKTLLLIPFLFLAGIALLSLGAIPLTNHAENQHAAQAWNSTTIGNIYKNGECLEKLYYACPQKRIARLLCKLNTNDLWGGIVIGLIVPNQPVVITGHAARWSYWQKSIIDDKCLLAGAGDFPFSLLP